MAELKSSFEVVDRDINHLTPKMKKVALAILRVIKIYNLPFRLYETRRSQERQDRLYQTGFSKVKFSNHQTGNAADFVYWDGKNWSWKYDDFYVHEAWVVLGFLVRHHVVREFAKCGINIRWGGPDGPGDTFNWDWPHWEVIT